jgi:glycerol-3-phosphate dehydrogenase
MPQNQNGSLFDEYASGSKKNYGLDDKYWNDMWQGMTGDINRQFSSNRYKMSQQAAAAGAPVSGQWMGDMAMLARGQTAEMGRAANDLMKQRATLALQDKWQALEAAKAKAGFASQEKIAQMQADIQKQLADLQKQQVMADIHAQATDWTRMLRSEGVPMSDTRFLGWMLGQYDPYSNW